MKVQVSALTFCAILAFGGCREDDDDRDSISIESIRAREGGVPATPAPSIGPGRVAVPSSPSEREDRSEDGDEGPVPPQQVISDGGLSLAFDAGLGAGPFGNAPVDGSVDFGANVPDAVATPVGTPWPTPPDLAE